VRVVQGKEGITVSEDEHPRPEVTPEQLAGLKPLLGGDSSITAGNASGLNDGAGAILLASGAALRTDDLQPLARILGATAAGIAPRVMGIGPVPAIQKLLVRTGLRLDNFDRIEINEAFAAQVLACTRSLGLPDDAENVNGNGGAIALGHPLGASGARLVMTALYALRRQNQSRALVSMCVGVGQGVALAVERA
jgi:3-oxoadipyl-CoA thiolase